MSEQSPITRNIDPTSLDYVSQPMDLTPNRLISQNSPEHAAHMIKAAQELGNVSLTAIANEGEQYKGQLTGEDVTVQPGMIAVEVKAKGNMNEFLDRVDQIQTEEMIKSREATQNKAA